MLLILLVSVASTELVVIAFVNYAAICSCYFLVDKSIGKWYRIVRIFDALRSDIQS